jgi:hypothetical protein
LHKNLPILLRGLPISREITATGPFYGILAQKIAVSFASGASKVGEPFGFARQPCLEAQAIVFASAGGGLTLCSVYNPGWSCNTPARNQALFLAIMCKLKRTAKI